MEGKEQLDLLSSWLDARRTKKELAAEFKERMGAMCERLRWLETQLDALPPPSTNGG